MDEILELRRKINNIDEQIVSLLNQRFNIVAEIAKYKKEHNLSIEDLNREKEHLNALSTNNMLILDIIQKIIDSSKEHQKNILK